MAPVVLTDLIQNEQYAREVLRESIRKSVFWQSGVIVPDADLSAKLNADVGSVFKFDYFNDLADNEARISDDSDTVAGVDGIGTGTDQAVGNYRNRSWGAKNITANLSATGDPLPVIAGRVGAYWGRQYDFTVLSVVKGLIASNVADDASDMVNDQTDVAVTVNMILDTKQTAGDASDMFTTMICHSAIKNKFENDGVTNKIYSDSGEYLYTELAGLRMVINDNVDSPSAGNYTSYIVGAGMFGWGDGAPKRPDEVEYIAGTGNGAGQENLWSRRNFSIHPYGFSFTNTTVAGESPTNAEFEDADNWLRNVERKRVPFAALTAALVTAP